MKEKSGLKIPGSLILVIATIFANFFNFLYNTYLGRTLKPVDFGIIGLLGGILYIIQILTGAIGRTLTYKSGFLSGKYGGAVKSYWNRIRKKIVLVSVVTSVIWIILSPVLANIFHTGNATPFLIFTPVIAIGLIGAVDSGFLSGNLFFTILGITNLLTAFFKFVFAFLLVKFGLGSFAYASVPVAMFIAFIINWFVILRLKTHKNETKVLESHMDFPANFFITAILTNISSIAFLSLDVILAKAFLSPVDAGLYTIISLTGQMVYFFGTLFSQFIVPLMSRAEGLGKSSKNLFYKLLVITTLASLFAYIPLGIFGNITVSLLFGEKVSKIAQFLPTYGLAMVFFGIAINIVSYHQLKKQHIFPIFSCILSAIEFTGLLFFHTNIATFVNVMFAMSLINLIFFLLLNFLQKTFPILKRNLIDFKDLFLRISPKTKTDPDKLKILIMNWRDTKHIWAGGAEVYIHEIAKRWVKDGHIVTVFCGNDTKNKRYENIEGVNIIRHGGFYTVYFWAFLYYILKLRGKFDLIIDSENGIPFFTPLYARKPVITIIYHVHQEVFMKNLNFVSSFIARFLEAKLMPLIYKNSKIITISNSTKENIEKIKIGKSEEIDIVFPGVDLKNLKQTNKSKLPSILYLGRLKPYKSIDTVINAMPKVIEKNTDAKLIIAGFGESRSELEKLVSKLKLESVVKFAGKVSENTKTRLLGEAWVFCQPSFVEGWGISVIEANACGTPVIASNVSGLKDSVNNPHTGYLVEHGNSEAFAEKINLLLKDNKLRKEMEKNSIEWAKKFSWEKSSEKLLKTIQEYIAL